MDENVQIWNFRSFSKVVARDFEKFEKFFRILAEFDGRRSANDPIWWNWTNISSLVIKNALGFQKWSSKKLLGLKNKEKKSFPV